MDIQTITQAIGSLGFPIVCCIALFVQQNKVNEQHKEETAKLAEAINNNTIALTKLSERFEK